MKNGFRQIFLLDVVRMDDYNINRTNTELKQRNNYTIPSSLKFAYVNKFHNIQSVFTLMGKGN